MYRSFFGIRSLPFGSSPDPRFLYVMPQIRETLACLQYGIAARKGFVVMTGEVGTGKTTLLKTVLSTFSKGRVSTAFVFNPRLDVLAEQKYAEQARYQRIQDGEPGLRRRQRARCQRV